MKPIPQNRKNVYFRSPLIYAAFQAAIDKGIITARSASERLELLITKDLRRYVPQMRKAGIVIPPSLIVA